MENEPKLPKNFKRKGNCWNKQRERHAEENFHLLPSICSIIAPITRLIGLVILLSLYPAFLPLSMCNNSRCESITACLHKTTFFSVQIWDERLLHTSFPSSTDKLKTSGQKLLPPRIINLGKKKKYHQPGNLWFVFSSDHCACSDPCVWQLYTFSMLTLPQTLLFWVLTWTLTFLPLLGQNLRRKNVTWSRPQTYLIHICPSVTHRLLICHKSFNKAPAFLT